MVPREDAVRDLEQRFEHLSLLYDLTASLGSSLSIESSLKIFLDKLLRPLQLDVAELYVIGRGGVGLKTALLRAAVGFSQRQRERSMLPEVVARALGETPAASVALDPFTDQPHGSADLFPKLKGRLRAVEAFRLNTGQRDVGVLLVGSVATTTIASALRGVLPQLARRAAIAIDHARVYDQLEREAVDNRYLLDSLREAVFRVDARGHLRYVNGAWTELLGYSIEECIGRPLSDFLHPDEPVSRLTALLRSDDRGQRRQLRFQTRDGNTVWLDCCSRTTSDGGNSGALTDITERKQLEERLLHAALHDALTDLPNRALFLNRLQYALSRTLRYDDYHFAVLFLDLDQFKLVNDSLGHEVGDQLLLRFASRLRSCLRSIDMTARLGGDEFAIIADGIATHEDAAGLAERIQQRAAVPYTLGSHEVYSSVSIGVALSSNRYQRPEDMVRDADTAMYRAKAAGRGCHVVFDEEMHARAVARLGLENDLRRALRRGELGLHYQPIIDLADMKITGFEALLRWKHPERGTIPPAEFLPLAEETGLIVPLGLHVLRLAAEQALEWQQKLEHPPTVSVNLAALQVRQATFVELVTELLTEVPVAPRYLILELTESAFLDEKRWHAQVFESLHKLGLRIAIDDFGTGYSALGYLTRFPVDILKIDRSFVAGVESTDQKHKIVRALIGLAHNLGMKVTAEGVETEAQLAQLQAFQCDAAQGWHFSKAVPAHEADLMLSAQG